MIYYLHTRTWLKKLQNINITIIILHVSSTIVYVYINERKKTNA